MLVKIENVLVARIIFWIALRIKNSDLSANVDRAFTVSADVVALAEVIYTERSFDRLPKLADALRDASGAPGPLKRIRRFVGLLMDLLYSKIQIVRHPRDIIEGILTRHALAFFVTANKE